MTMTSPPLRRGVIAIARRGHRDIVIFGLVMTGVAWVVMQASYAVSAAA